METVSCPLCNCNLASTPVRTSGDIVKCANCDVVYLRTRPTVEELEKHYQSYATTPGSHMALPKTIQEIRTTGLRRNNIMSDILAFTGADRGRFLDIGSGWGAFLLNAREHGFTVNGVEICREMADFATNMLGIPTFKTQVEKCQIFEPDTFQVVSLLHTLEHLPYTEAVLSFLNSRIRAGGLLCGIVPNFDSWASVTHKEHWDWLDPVVHYVHFTPKTLQKALWNFGFNVQKIYTATGDYNVALLPHEGIRKQIEAQMHGEEIRFFAQKI